MKIAVTATQPSLDAPMDPRFGRCPYFVIVESDLGTFEALENTNAALDGGAGIQSAQTIAASGAQVILTGNCGPNAFSTLSAAGIEVITGCSGSVRGVVEQYKTQQLQPVSEPSVASHFGTGATAPEGQTAPTQGGSPPPMNEGPGMDFAQTGGMGRGRCTGRGQGMGGRGRGRGAGGGRGRGRCRDA